MPDPMGKVQRLALAAQAFRPSAPVDRYSMLAGRQPQLMDVISAVSQAGQHVALYGERGVGKTSLSNILAEVYKSPELPNYQAASVNCNTEDTFSTVWSNIFRELDVEAPGAEVAPEDVRHILERLDPPALIVLDELDRLEDDPSLTLLADTIKTLSDHTVTSTVVLVGVASSIDDLIGEHESVERALVQVEMPRMSRDELREIIDRGTAIAGITAEPEAIDKIATLSEGLPHYTHLLSYYAAQRVVTDDRMEITVADVDAAVEQAVAKHSIRSDYQRAVRSARTETLYPQVLLACALAPKDSLGSFPAGAIRDPLARISGHRYEIPAFAPHLKKLLEPERGAVLRREGEPRRYFYRFSNPLLEPYVILHGLSSGVITDEHVIERAERAAAITPTTNASEPGQLF